MYSLKSVYSPSKSSLYSPCRVEAVCSIIIKSMKSFSQSFKLKQLSFRTFQFIRMILFIERNASVNSCCIASDFTPSILTHNKHASGHSGTSSFNIKHKVFWTPSQNSLISGQCHNACIKDPLFPQPCPHKSDMLGFILSSLYGVIYDRCKIFISISLLFILLKINSVSVLVCIL